MTDQYHKATVYSIYFLLHTFHFTISMVLNKETHETTLVQFSSVDVDVERLTEPLDINIDPREH